MTAEELLDYLDCKQIKVAVQDGQLSLTGEKSKLTPEIIERIQRNKSALISILTIAPQMHSDNISDARRYQHNDGSYFKIDRDDLDTLIEFVDMIYSFSVSQKYS